MTGVIMSAYFFGFILGSFICPRLIRRVGHIRAFAAMAAWGARSLLVYFAVGFLSVAVFALYRMGRRAPVLTAEQGVFVPLVRTSQAALEMGPRAEHASVAKS